MSTPRDFSGCGEFPALFATRAMRSRRRARWASLSGARHGLAPKRKGQLGHLTAVHLRTSSLEPPQQSRQCARIAAAGGAIGAWWIDSVTSLAILWFLIKEGREAWTGEECCADE